MKRNKLAICDPEREYAYRLTDALSRREDLPFEILTFTSVEKLEESLAQGPIQLLMIAQSVFLPERKNQWKVSRILLLWDPGEIPLPGFAGISKYSGVSRILKKIMEEAAEDESLRFLPTLSPNDPSYFLGIYSPVGRCLQTTFSLCLGQLLARSHKVLYLNFESYSGLPRMLERSFETDFSDLLYFLGEPKDAFLGRLYRMVENVNGMDMVPPAVSGLDIFQMPKEEWTKLMEVLQASRYEYVILDLSDGVQGLMEILGRCACVYTIVKEDGFAAAKLGQYKSLLARTERGDILDKTREVMLPVFQKLPRDLNHLTVGELAEFTERMLKADGTKGV